jgi:ABC-2 type transport system ATP-binding protein
MHVIEFEHLTKDFGEVRAVDDLSFGIRVGTIVGFLGPNGSGKTTSLRALLGLVEPTSGTARIDGRPYRELDNPIGTVGAVLEATNFHRKRSGRNHLRVIAAAAGIDQTRVDEVLEQVELTPVARRAVGGYSLGMRQRLSVAGALLGRPRLLILDEPANGLDPEGIRWLRDFLRSFVDDGGTVFISSHVLAEVQQLADDVVIIHRGKLVAHESVEGLTARSRAAGAARVRTPQAEQLRARLADGGITATIVTENRLEVAAPAERVGEVAAAAGIVLHELTSDAASLEEAFLELTAGETVA